jgi:hypothetical protein
MNSKKWLLLLPFLLFSVCRIESVKAQKISTEKIKEQIELYKKDARGPYFRIKWFCEDGSIREPKDPCPDDIGGIQHASYKTEVVNLAKNNGIHFGNILSFETTEEFWDQKNNHSRLKQYQLVKYLTLVDDGWIYRKGRYYRGAMQSEDEEAWGKEFFEEILSDDRNLAAKYYLLRESLKDVPHHGDSNLSQQMRSQSKVIAEELPNFMNTRIKIHGNPDQSDIDAVKEYKRIHETSLTPEQAQKIDELLETMKAYYTPVSMDSLIEELSRIEGGNDAAEKLAALLQKYDPRDPVGDRVASLSDAMTAIRVDLPKFKKGKDRLALLDMSNKIGNSLFIESQKWKPADLKELLEKIEVLSYSALGSGLIEFWEWKEVRDVIESGSDQQSMTLAQLQALLVKSRGIVEWSTAMVKAEYGEEVSLFSEFEPKSYQFIDDRIRSSIILDLGQSVSQLGAIISQYSSIDNDVLGISQQSTIRGLNPGYAYGELVVVKGESSNVEFVKDKIYVFDRPPSGLKPVAGIMTVSEGNLVSHVQLLARNLGVPNAALSAANLNALLPFNGKNVFYAVSNKGNVILKLDSEMTAAEKGLFTKEERGTNKIEVPVDRIKLDQTDILNLREVLADDSGKICGPKAANLGQLKSIFPDHVVEGFVIPFGIFRKHLDNSMPGEGKSYWQYLNDTYAEVEKMRQGNNSMKDIEAYQLERLSRLKKAIESMELNPDFISQLETEFVKALGSPIGSVPVFLRSDTNMEDLKEFTGAGLNLTLFNVNSKEDILNGIKKVWASPYTERSMKWRQKYLLNPEYVFPSIVVIPGVNVDHSGVVVTTGINEGEKNDLTIAFSHGAGGAVDGQVAETRLVTEGGNVLLSPAREPSYVYLKEEGGTERRYTSFEKPIMSEKNMQSVRDLVKEVRVKVPEKTDPSYKGAYDMEMGFKDDKLWLFQIRPFVENKKAKSSEYLESITPKVDSNVKISLAEKI